MSEDSRQVIEAGGEIVDAETGEVVGKSTVPAARAHGARSVTEVLEHISSPEALEEQKQLMAAYDEACSALIGPNDVQEESGRTFKKKSAWRKLARHFGISTEVIRSEGWWEDRDWEEVPHYVARVTVRAVAPWGQYMTAVGKCSTRETRFTLRGPLCPTCQSGMWDNREDDSRDSDFRCKSCGRELVADGYDADELGVDQRVPNPTARAKAEHDVESTAQTRATNRAVSDLIAAGEVSAEEMEGGSYGGNGRGAERSDGGSGSDHTCPDCGGEVWDNRPKIEAGDWKENAPKFTCKDKDDCGWKTWDSEAEVWGESDEGGGSEADQRSEMVSKVWQELGRWITAEDVRKRYLRAYAADREGVPDTPKEWTVEHLEGVLAHLREEGMGAVAHLEPEGVEAVT